MEETKNKDNLCQTILQYLDEKGGSCSLSTIKEHFLSKEELQQAEQVGGNDAYSESCWQQIIKSSNLLSRKGCIIKKDGVWFITKKGINFLNKNEIKSKRSSTNNKTNGLFYAICTILIALVSAYFTYRSNKIGEKTNELSEQNSNEKRKIDSASMQPLFTIEIETNRIKKPHNFGFDNAMYVDFDSIYYQTLNISNVGYPIKTLYKVTVASYLQFWKKETKDEGLTYMSYYIPYPKWYEWEYTQNKSGILYKASSLRSDWALGYIDSWVAQESLNDSSNYYWTIADLISIQYIDIFNNRQISCFINGHEISKESYINILKLYVQEGKEYITTNYMTGETSLEPVVHTFPNITVFPLKDSLEYRFPPEYRILNGWNTLW